MRTFFAILLAKIAFKINRMTGSGGTALPGLIAQKLDPNILAKLTAVNFPRGIIVVTGTNGKTTTTQLIANILDVAGIKYTNNKSGSNLERGLITSIISSSTIGGRIDAEIGLFEVDEAFMPRVCRAIKPKMIVVTNLFRDQLDRYGELDKIARSFRELFEDLPHSKLVLNADDPLVASLGYNLENERKVVYFGVDDFVGKSLKHDRTADSIYDPFTYEKLYFTQRYFGHIGKYRSNSGFKRPKLDFSVSQLKQEGIKSMSFVVNNATKPIKLDIPGVFNVYNSLASYATAKSFLSLADKEIITGIGNSKAVFGRSEVVHYKKRELLMLLIKNPTGFNQIIQTYLINEADRLLVLIINDNYADGRDISWLWDASVEDLCAYKGKIVVSGTRAWDMALRLKYAGLSNVTVETDSNQILATIEAQTSPHSPVYILSTYTAMLALRAQLVAGDSQMKEYWQ